MSIALKALEEVEAHFSIDMQDLTDLKRRWFPPMWRCQNGKRTRFRR